MHPSGLVAHAQAAFEFEGLNVVLGLRQQVHRLEPSGQRQLGGFEDRPAQNGRLLPAGRALPITQPFAFERAMSYLSAVRADKTVRPALCDHCSVALLPRSRTVP